MKKIYQLRIGAGSDVDSDCLYYADPRDAMAEAEGHIRARDSYEWDRVPDDTTDAVAAWVGQYGLWVEVVERRVIAAGDVAGSRPGLLLTEEERRR